MTNPLDNFGNSIEPLKLMPTKPDAELAVELRAKILEASKSLMAAMNEAKSAGFIVNMQFGLDQLGHWVCLPHGVSLTKAF